MAHCEREDCIHKKICYEVNSLPCRKDFIWYDGKFGCPHYNSTSEVAPKSEVASLLDELKKEAIIISDFYKKLADDTSDCDYSKIEYRGTQIGALLVLGKIIELKKKYTEGV